MELIFAIRNFESFIPNQYGPTDFCPQLPGNKFSLASKIQSIYVCVIVAANINLFQFSYIEKHFKNADKFLPYGNDKHSRKITACPDSWPFQLLPPSTHSDILLTTCLVLVFPANQK